MSLKAERLNRGLTVAEVARIAKVSNEAVYYWERAGSRPTDPEVAKRVADHFGIQVTDIWPVEPREQSAA